MLQLNDNYCFCILPHIHLVIVGEKSSPLSLKFGAMNRHPFCFFILSLSSATLTQRSEESSVVLFFFFFLKKNKLLSTQFVFARNCSERKKKQWYRSVEILSIIPWLRLNAYSYKALTVALSSSLRMTLLGQLPVGYASLKEL